VTAFGRKTLGGLQIVVPRDLADEDRLFVCRVPKADGSACGHVEPLDERSNLAHMRACVAENRESIHSQSPRRRLPAIYESVDPEVDAHMKRVGDRMRREGRLVVKPSERAGFS
jgi:hypothetical protein